MGTIETGEFQRRVQEVIRLPFRPLVPPLLDKQVPSLRKEIASQLMLARQNENGQQRQQQQVRFLYYFFIEKEFVMIVVIARCLDDGTGEESAAGRRVTCSKRAFTFILTGRNRFFRSQRLAGVPAHKQWIIS